MPYPEAWDEKWLELSQISESIHPHLETPQRQTMRSFMFYIYHMHTDYNSFSAPVWGLQVAANVLSGAFYLEHYVSIQTL